MDTKGEDWERFVKPKKNPQPPKSNLLIYSVFILQWQIFQFQLLLGLFFHAIGITFGTKIKQKADGLI
jgi:hypothetical protein